MAAFAEIFEQQSPSVYKFAMHYMSDEKAAEDMVMEVFECLWFRDLTRFRFKAALSTWLFRVTANRCKNKIRWQSRQPLSVGLPGVTSAEAELERIRVANPV